MARQNDPRLDKIVARIDRAKGNATLDITGRKAALSKMESLASTRVILYYSPHRAIVRTDVLPFSHLLKSVGTVPNLDLVIVSPGGDGTAAETMVDLLRKYCTNRLRVVVPAYAKSAATLIALSADEIVMGESSELGPIDAQINVMQDNVEQQISADHVIRAHDEAKAHLVSTNQEDALAAQIKLASISAPFLQHCRDLMAFGKDFAGKQLKQHMFRQEYPTDPPKYDELIGNVISNLLASSVHKTHGRMITAKDIQEHDDLKCLKVKELAADDPYWMYLSELYIRTDVVAQQNDVAKVLYAKDFQMFGG